MGRFASPDVATMAVASSRVLLTQEYLVVLVTIYIRMSRKRSTKRLTS